MYINDYACIEANNGCQHSFVGYYISMDVIVALIMTTVLELPDSRVSGSKRQVTPFLYIGSRPAASTLGLRHSYFPMAVSQQSGTVPKTLQRYEIFRNLYRFIPKKNKNSLSQGL